MATIDPPIRKFMTAQPYWIHAGEKLTTAQEMMSRHRIRHLPVMDSNKVIGILSERDIKLIAGLDGIDPAQLVVMDVCHGHPYVVGPEALVREVAEVMASKRYGSAIVMQGSKLVGIFTTVDACRALASVIEKGIAREKD